MSELGRKPKGPGVKPRPKPKSAKSTPSKDRRVTFDPSDASPPVPAGNFGTAPVLPLASMYLGAAFNGGNTGAVVTKSELNIKVVDFFDYDTLDPSAGGVPQDVTNYFWQIKQNLFDNGTTLPLDRRTVFSRVRKLSVFVLPVKGFDIIPGTAPDPNDNNAGGMFTVNFQVPGVQNSIDVSPPTVAQLAGATNTQVTNVLPQVDTFWKKVGQVNYDNTFKSGVIRPFFKDASQCLFQMSIRDSATGLPYLRPSVDLKIRVKVVIHVDNPVSPSQQAFLTVFKNEDFSLPATEQNGASWIAPVKQYVQMAIVGAQDLLK
jgi:hypothetical protein